MTEYAEGGIVQGPRFQQEHVGVADFVDDKIQEARIIGFAAGVVVGVAWMLLVLLVADRLV